MRLPRAIYLLPPQGKSFLICPKHFSFVTSAASLTLWNVCGLQVWSGVWSVSAVCSPTTLSSRSKFVQFDQSQKPVTALHTLLPPSLSLLLLPYRAYRPQQSLSNIIDTFTALFACVFLQSFVRLCLFSLSLFSFLFLRKPWGKLRCCCRMLFVPELRILPDASDELPIPRLLNQLTVLLARSPSLWRCNWRSFAAAGVEIKFHFQAKVLAFSFTLFFAYPLLLLFAFFFSLSLCCHRQLCDAHCWQPRQINNSNNNTGPTGH